MATTAADRAVNVESKFIFTTSISQVSTCVVLFIEEEMLSFAHEHKIITSCKENRSKIENLRVLILMKSRPIERIR
jgi:hypothetical protein